MRYYICYEIRLWTIVGLIITIFEIVSTSEEDSKKLWENMKELREFSNFLFFYNFCTVRIYLLAYIILVYPVFVEKYKMLITPWLVVSGLRILTPDALFRIYFWIRLFLYWMMLLDRDIKEAEEHESSEKKKKYLQNLDNDDEALVRETRRRIKGIRLWIAQKRISEILPFIGNLKEPSNDEIKETDSIPNNSDIYDIPTVTDTSFSSETEQEFHKLNSHILLWKSIKHWDKNGPVHVTDCILQQITDLVVVLVSKPKTELLKESKEIDDDAHEYFDVSLNYPAVSYPILKGEEKNMNSPRYRKHRYLTDYPGIFDKENIISSEYRNQRRKPGKFGRMLMKTTDSDDTLRETLEDLYGEKQLL